jgi:hypothetical protein
VVENVYIREVTADDTGALYNKGLLTVKNVSQFGPYDPALYMAQPIDDNTYPPDLCADFPADMLSTPNIYDYLPFGQ